MLLNNNFNTPKLSLIETVQDVYFTKHGLKRANQRNVTFEDINYALEFGKRLYHKGLIFYIVLNKFVKGINPSAKNVVVLTDHTSKIITVYKDFRALKNLKKRIKK
jgi:hypothetical protein